MSSYDVSLVRLDLDDALAAELFHRLPGTARYGTRRFPTATQYHELVYVLELTNKSNAARLVALAQRDWHVRGQNGCMFARLAALGAGALRWDTLVVTTPCERIDDETIQTIEERVQERIMDPRVEILSIVFPEIRTACDVVRAVRRLVIDTNFWLERDEVGTGSLRLNLRYPIDQTGTQAWVMGFGPFDFMPKTRQGPYFELSIRTKNKPQEIFHRLNQDRAVAHLADAPLVMSERHWEHRWESTRRRTRMILGGEPDDLSAAKATLALPLSDLSSRLPACLEVELSE
jgi:hypothetical protein